MITSNTMLYLYVETPLHAGVGSGLSSIDLPIQRERTTQYPMIQSSGIKGKLRSTIEKDRAQIKGTEREREVNTLFGPPADNGQGSEHAGALIAGDARILLFPVRSLNGVFAYTTSCNVLARFKRDFERGQTNIKLPWNIPDALETSEALVTTKSIIQANNTIVLEEFSFTARKDPQIDTIATWIADHAIPKLNGDDYWPNKVKSSLVILPEVDFRDFALYATEVITRVRIDRASKTVENRALWTEEHLPTDTLLYVPIYATNARKKDGPQWTSEQVLKRAKELSIENGNYLQLGGDETVGRGMVCSRWADEIFSERAERSKA